MNNLTLSKYPFTPRVSYEVACSKHLDCGEQRKEVCSTRVGVREDWERGKETPVKLILESSLTFDCQQQLWFSAVNQNRCRFPGKYDPITRIPSTSLSRLVNTVPFLSNNCKSTLQPPLNFFSLTPDFFARAVN